MPNEFIVKNGLIVGGNVVTSGTITINGALAATQSWVTSQGYLTSASLSGYATQSYVTSAIAALVDSAPAALDTLNELAAALGDDANFSTTITNSIASKQSQLNGTGLVRMSGTSVSYDNTTYLISNFGNIEGDHTYGYPSSDGWYKIAEVVLTSTCQSFNLWGEYRDTGYFDNSHYRIHITARAECDFPTNNENHAINVNIYGSSTNDTYFSNNVRVVLTQSSSNYRKYELQYYRSTWDTGSWRLQTLGWTTYTTSQTAGTPTGTPRVYYVSKFSTDNIFVANRLSIGTTYAGFAANIAGTTYIIGASVWVNDGYGLTNASSGGTGFFPYSDGTLVFNSANSEKMRVASSGNVGIGTNSPGYKLEVNGGATGNNIARFTTGGAGGGTRGLTMYSDNSQVKLQVSDNAGGVGTWAFLNLNPDGGNVGIGTTNPIYKLHVVGDLYVNGTNGAFTTDNSQSNLYFLNLTRSTTSLVTAGNVGIKVANPTATLSLGTSSYDNNPLAGLEYSQVTGGGRLDLKVQTWGTGSDYALTTGLTVLTPGFNTNNVRVGIGTSSPATPLHVTGGGTGTGGWNRTATLAATYPGLIFNSNGTKWGGMAYDYSAAMRFWVNANNDDIFAGTQAMSILNNGNVGIGTSNPIYKLQVAGSAYVNGGTLFLDSDQYLRWGNSNQGIVGSNDNHVSIVSGGATRQSIYADGRTYFPGLDLSISNVNSSHGTANYFRGDGSHFVLGTGGTLYLNYANTSGSTFIYGTTYINGEQAATRAWVGAQGYLTSVSDVWVNTTGDTMTGALTIQGGWASTILDGDNVVLRKPNYSSGGWARTLLNFQEYDTTSLFQIGGYGNNNTMTYGYLGSAYNTPTIKWYANKNVAFSGNIIIDDAADNNRYQKGGSFLNLRDPWDNIHFSNNGGGIYVDSPIHYWRSGSGSTYWMTLTSGNLGIGTTSPGWKLHVAGESYTSGVVRIGGTNPFYFEDYGGGWYMSDSAWIRTYNSKSVWTAGGLLGTDGGLTVGYGGATPPSGGAIISGNVGIGTTSPGYKLHVSGNVYINETLFVNQLTTVEDSLIVYDNLGVGTTTPSSKFHVVTGTTGNIAIFQGGAGRYIMTGTDGSGQYIEQVGNSSGERIFRIQNNNGSGAYTQLFLDGGNQRIYTSTNVNVGIGTTSPGSKLSILGNNDVLNVTSQTGDTSLPTKMLAQYAGLFNNGSNGHHLYINSSQELGSPEFNITKTWGGYLTFGVSGDGTARTRALYVNGNGYVGVNVNPISGDRFEVAGSVRIHTGNNWDAIQIYSDGANGYIQGLGDETGLRIRSEYGNILLADNRGNVGIGTSTPQVKLDVNGALGIVGSNFIYFGHTTGNIGAWATRQYSSGSTHTFNAQTFIFNNEGYGSYQHMALTANGVNLRGKNTIDSTDSWLRLNQSGDYGSGVYTPGLMRADGGFQVSGSTVWHAGNDGSGSGLDADLLDGQNSTEFLRLLSGGAEASLDSYTDNGFRSVSFAGHSQHLLSWNAGGSTGTVQQLFHYGVPNNGWRIRNKTDNSSWSDWGYVVMASSNQGLISGTIATQSWVGSQSYATTSYVTTQINNLIAGAPGALDTLDELAAALGDDANFATTVTNSIAGKVSKAGDIITTSNNYGLVIDHTPVLGDFVDALLVRSTTSGQRAQIGFATVDADGNHHRASIRAYKGPGTLEGVFGIALRQAGSGAHIQRLTLDYLGNLTIGGFLTESSSLKLKENVETSEGNLEKVVNLRPVTYNKIGSQTTELGLIAEEVAEVYPEFVQYDENGDPIGVNYSRLTAALIGAVKQLTKRIETLENNG
jgi:hypothetical protein